MTMMDWLQILFISIVVIVGLGGFVLAVLKKD